MARKAQAEALKPSPDAEDEDVDANTEAVERSGPVAESDEFITSVAKEAGWTPKDEWRGKPENWEDERSFLKSLPRVLAEAKLRGERAARAAAEAIEEDRRRARDEARRVIRESDDKEERDRAAERLAENAGPHPETLAWRARNSWFDADPDAQAVAVRAVNEMAQRGASIPDQLAEAEARVRRRFPEHFGPAPEVKLSEARRPAPAVQQGTRAGTSTPREKGFAQVPQGDRADFNRYLLKKFMGRGMSQADAEAKWAKAYWSENERNESR